MLIKYSTMKRCISLILATVLLISVFPMPAKATESALSDRIIVSLGDSYSSGEGIEPFYGQDDPLSEKVKNEDWLAHRSENAWSGMLTIPGVTGTMAENFDTHWFFAASSGAETKHLLEAQKKPYSKGGSLTGHWGSEAKVSGTEDVSPQLNVFGELDDRKADYVTMTLGGNDADFAGIITEVVLGSTYLNLSGLSDKLNKTWDKFYAEDGIGDKLSESYAAIAEKAGEQAHILVAGYPQLLDSTGIGFFVSKEEAQLVNTAVTNFNKAIEQVVNESRNAGINISFVSVEEAFSGHGAYSDDPYINEIMFGPILQEQDLKDIGVSSAYSVHPNYKGACAYAKCVQEKINELEGVPVESDYMNFLNDYPEYNYYSLVDINGDGVLELMVVNEVNDDFQPVGDVDIFVYRNGEICLGLSDLWAKYDVLFFDKDKHWIAQLHGGAGGYGMSFYYMDDQLRFQKTSYDARCWRVDENGNEIWEKYYNDVEVTDETIQSYENLASWTSNNSENIVFQALPKAALIGEWNFYCGGVPHEDGYWQDVWVSSLNLNSDGTADAVLAIADSELYSWYTGTWSAEPCGVNEFLLQLDVSGGSISYEEDGDSEEANYNLRLRARLDQKRLTFEKVSGDNICLYYGERYERNLQFDTWVKNRGTARGPITFEKIIQLYPETAEYTVYDIDNNGVAELIIHEASNNYHIFTYVGENAKLCYEWILTTCNFYAMEGNGVIVQMPHYVGVYELHGQYLEMISYDMEVEAFMSGIDKYSAIDNFIPVSDKTLLKR